MWAWRQDGQKSHFPRLTPFKSYADLIGVLLALNLAFNLSSYYYQSDVNHSFTLLAHTKEKLNGRKPKSIIVGGLGRVGSGATSMLKSVGAETEIWDHNHTANQSINCDFLLAFFIFCSKIFYFLL